MKLRKCAQKISFIFVVLIGLLTLFDVDNYNPVKAEELQSDYTSGSIIQWVLNNDLPDGTYNVTVTGSTDGGTTTETITYPIELVNYYDDVTYSTSTSLGDSTNTEKKMLIVKYHGNLTIDSGVTLTVTRNGNYTYYKGMYIHVVGTLVNNGEISMTARGTYNQAGENVYLWRNLDSTYEYVPAVGASGGASTVRSSEGRSSGKTPAAASDRKTGGGASGGAMRGASYSYTVKSGAGGAGTSYSGGSGGGAISARQKNWTGYSGSSTGGAGGAGRYSSSTSGYSAGGGAGNPGGSGVNGASAGSNGTGGLLILYSAIYENNGSITSQGTSGGYSGTRVPASGGGSGGGSINIFYTESIATGTTSVSGGAVVGNGGAAGGTGTVTETQLILDEEFLTPTLSSLVVDKGELKPTYDKDTNTYGVTLNSEHSLVNISAELTNGENYITSGVGEFEIPAGESTHDIVVTSKYGMVNTYTIEFYRSESSYQYLRGITIDGEEIEGFDPEILNYTVDLPYDVETINLDVLKGRASQEVLGTGEITIPTGTSVHLINVISEDNQNSATYTLTINRAHTSKLKNLSVEGYDLDIEFDPETYKYYVDIPSNVISVTVNAEAYDDEAVVKITGNGYIKGNSGTIKVTVTEPNSETTIYTVVAVKEGEVSEVPYEFSYTGSYQTFEAPNSAYYKIELWGARGGYGRQNMSLRYRGGFGAYTKGEIYLEKGEKIYIYVGGVGANGASVNKYTGGAGGWNGGAYGGHDSNHDSKPDPAGGGGGATDVRLSLGEDAAWNNFDSLKSRIMVAGGGAGGTYCNQGGAGGALNNTNGHLLGTGQAGGTYTSGSGGGAGGYYGGRTTFSDCGQAYGGTSYVSGCTDCRSLDETSTSDNVLLTDNNVHYSGYTFENIEMYTGAQTMPSTSTGYMTGNNGNGYARITAIPNKSTNNFLSSLTSDVGELSPSFDMIVEEYTLTLGAEEENVNITAKTEDSTATITGLGEYNVAAPSDVIEIEVTAEDGSIRTYKINVVRELSNNSIPEDITISGLVPSLCAINDGYCKLSSEFDPITYTYYMTIPSRIKELEFTVTKGHYFQEVVGDGVVALAGGENKVTIEIMSEDKTSTTTYTYVIERDMTGNTDIADLTVNLKDVDEEGIETLTPVDIGFDLTITEYYFSIPNEYTSLELGVTLDDENASYVVTGNENFIVGNNVVEIVVTAQNGEVGVYTLNVYREENSNIFIKELIVKNGEEIFELNPTFIKTINTYTLEVENLVKTIDIEAVADSETTSIEGTGTFELKTGLNTFKLITTSESGDVGTYTVNITRKKSSDASLKSLEVTNFTISPEFASETLEYSLTVDPHTRTLDIVTEVNEEKSTVKIIGNSNFQVGENTVTIRVTAEDGTIRDYVLKVTKEASENNYLSNLEIDNYDLSTEFNKEITEYSFTVENEIKSLKVTGIAEDTLSTVKGNGTYQLQTGENEIYITVTSESGSTRDYVLKVTRKLNSNSNILMINTNREIIFNPEFNSSVYEYTINVGYDISDISINGVPEVSTTTIKGNATHVLNVGENEITLVATAEDGSTSTYTLKIIRDQNASLDLSYLNILEGQISPTFNKSIVNYTAKVSNEITDITVDYEVEVEENTVIVSGNENLQVGENLITLTVSNAEGQTKDYTITVTRQEESIYSNYLSSLTVSSGTLSPEFNKEIIIYNVEVPYDVSTITVDAVAEDTSCTVSGNTTYTLNVGKNNLYVLVTDPDGIIRTYQIIVNRLESDDARIKNMSVANTTILPIFDKDTYEYSLSTTNVSLDFNIELMNENATYEIIGNENFVLGENTVIINVLAANKVNTKTYTITVNKLPSNNNNLLTLGVTDKEITPTFSKNTTVYYLTVEKEVNSIEIYGQTEDPNATVEGLGVTELAVGENILEVMVTSETGNVKNYTIIVTRKGEEENRLSAIYVDNVLVEGFDPEIPDYSLSVPYESEKVNITVDKMSSLSNVEGIGEKELVVGENTSEITVTSENGDVRVYKLNITRKEIVSALLDDIKLKYYSVEPEFNSNVFEYTVTIDNEITSLEITPTLKDPKGTYEITGNSDFIIGMNTVTITVTASDGVTKQDYILNVNRQIYSNAFLEYIAVNKGELSPEFDKTVMEYTVNVDKDIESITIDSEPTVKSSTVEGNGTFNLEKGDNVFPLVVTSNLGVTRTYKVNVVRAKSDYNLLDSLQVKYGSETIELSPTFESGVNEYTGDIPQGIDTLTINATTSENASITGIGEVKVVGGENIINVIVTSESGISNTYKLTLTREKSSNNYLTSLEPSVGDLEPGFTYENTEYSMHFDSSVTMLSFDYTTEDRFASVTGGENQIIADGTNVRQIIVTAEDGTERIYNITITKDRSDESRLESLEVAGYTLDQTFDSNVYEYNITVPNSKTIITSSEITAVAIDKNATVSKESSLNLLTTKVNEYKIIVTAKDGFTISEYVIKITREKGSDSTLSELSFNEGTSQENFSPSRTEYNITIPNTIQIYSSNNITYKLKDPNATVVMDPVDLSEGRVFKIIVTSEDGSSTTTYTINIEYELSNNGRLKQLYITGYKFNETYNSYQNTYTVDIFENEEKVTVNGEVEDTGKATIISGLGEVDVTSGNIVHNVMVQAEDGSINIYEININKTKTHEKYLKNIEVTDLTDTCDDECVLTPSFASETLEYKMEVPYSVNSIELLVKKISENQDVKIYQNGLLIDTTTNSLEVGMNTFTIKVTNSDAEEVIYTVNIRRDRSPNNYLSSLKLTSPEYEFEFDKEVTEYYYEIPYDLDSVEVEAVAESTEAIVIVSDNTYLVEGNNDVRVTVTAANGDEREYIIHVTRGSEYNNYLQSLTVSSGVIYSLSPKFNKGVMDYKVEVENTITKITIEGVAEDLTSEVTGIGEFELEEGNNKFQLLVTAATGEVRTYTINVTRLQGSNTFIENLVIKNGEISPIFDKGTSEYTVTVEETINALDMEITLEDPNATYEVIGNTKLESGKNTVEIKVISEDKKRIKKYTLNVDKAASSNNYLSMIKLNDEDLEGFNREITEYTVIVENDIKSVNLGYVRESLTSTVTGSGTYSLAEGNNELYLYVKAENGETRIYTVNIYREYDNYLSAIVTDRGEVTPIFDKKITEYTLTVTNEIKDITIIGMKSSSTSTVTGNDKYDLAIGDNLITLTVTAQDGEERDYNIKVIREASSNNYLASLSITEGILDKEFAKEEMNYITYISNEYDTVSISYETEDENATVEIIGNENLILGENEIIIRVTASNGDIRDYILSVIRQEAELFSNYLTSLTVDKGTMAPAFVKEINEYTVTVGYDDEVVTVSGVRESPDATVEGLGRYNIEPGRNEIFITVTSKDLKVRTYKLIVYRVGSSEARLSNLMFEEGVVTPVFNKNVFEYNMTIGANVSKLTPLLVTPLDTNATYEIIGADSLTSNTNEVIVRVTAQDGETTLDYKITVTKETSSVARLLDLTSNFGELSPEFDKDNPGIYIIRVENSVNSIILSGEKEYENSTVEGLGLHELQVGSNSIVVKVTSETGNVTSYALNVIRENSSNAYLSNLGIRNQYIEPEFDKETNEYTLKVSGDIVDIEIYGQAEDSSATIEGLGEKELVYGENEFNVIVTSASGETNTYTIVVNREYVESAKIASMSVKEGELSPGFDKDITSYDVYIPNEKESITLDIELEDENSTYEVIGNENLEVGENKIEIVVTTKSGATNTYTINVVRQISSNNFLKKITVSNGELSPKFDKYEMNYQVEVETDIESITVEAEPEDSNSAVAGIGTYEIEKGSNIINIRVLSTANVERVYNIEIIRKYSSDNLLKTLEVSEGELNPIFDPNVNEYRVSLESEIENVVISGTLSDENATVEGLGEKELISSENKYEITVTSEDGETNVYTITVTRGLSSELGLLVFAPDVGEMDKEYTDEEDEYTLKLDSNTSVVNMRIEAKDSRTTISGETLITVEGTGKVVSYEIKAEDGSTRTITLNIERAEEVKDIELNKTSFVIVEGEQEQLEAKVIPTTIETKMLYKVEDETVATIDEEGLITGLTKGYTKILIYAEKDPTMSKEVVVEVIPKEIMSNVYIIERTDYNYITGMEENTTLLDFMSDIENESSTLKIYDKDNVEIIDYSVIVKTGQKIRLEINGKVYDELIIILRGDINEDGVINVSDKVQLQDHILSKTVIEDYRKYACDLEIDEVINVSDNVKLGDYILKRITTLN